MASPSPQTFFQEITAIEGVSSLYAQVGGTASPYIWGVGDNINEYKQLFNAASRVITENVSDIVGEGDNKLLGKSIENGYLPHKPLLFNNQVYRSVSISPISLHAIGPRRSSIFVYCGKVEIIVVTSYPAQPNVVLPKVERFLKENHL